MLGTCLGDRYTLTKALGQRSGRQTYLAWDSDCRSSVVVKVLPFSYGFDWDNLDHFERETRLLKQLLHPAIPQYLDGFEIDLPDFKGFAWVQTYIPAPSLAEHLQQGRTFSEDELWQIATDLLKVLVFLHSRNPVVIHRDIKPSNVLLGDRTGHSGGTIHLIDFGAVQTGVSLLEGTVTVAGTFGYGAPEQFRGEAIPASDVYGIGMTLIRLITGANPACLPIRDGHVIFEGDHLSKRFLKWIKGATHAEVHKRFKSAAVALSAIAQKDLAQLPTDRLLPRDSNLVFSKTSQSLSCTIPAMGLPGLGKLFKSVASLLYVLFFLLMFTFPFALAIFVVPAIRWFVLCCAILGLTGVIKSFLIRTFGQVRLEVTPSKISWIAQWGRLKKDEQTLTAEVIKIKRTLPKTVLLGPKDNRQLEKIPLTIEIQDLNRTLKITAPAEIDKNDRRTEHGLTEIELHWLAAELSEWFDVPIESVYFPIKSR